MPRSRKRPGHHENRSSSAVPPRQRVKGTVIWALLLAVFGLIVSFFATGTSPTGLAIGALVGAIIGFIIGKNMEKQAAKKHA